VINSEEEDGGTHFSRGIDFPVDEGLQLFSQTELSQKIKMNYWNQNLEIKMCWPLKTTFS